MSGASPVTQSIIPLHSQSARDFCRQSDGLFFVGFVSISYCKRSPIYCFLQTLFATALTFADGMLTPAVSVTSAVAGIGLSVQSLNHNISSISIGILVALFLAQRFGTAKLSFIFSPGKFPEPAEVLLITFLVSVVAFLWFGLIGACGIYNITSYPAILRAFDPSQAVLC
jgi:KUP system potassium uptake protein